MSPSDTKEQAQIQLIELLLDISKFKDGCTVLDVGCGLGGTTRYLAKKRACDTTGITISGRQVQLAKKLTAEEAGRSIDEADKEGYMALDDGKVRFVEMDAETMGEHFPHGGFDAVWISEAMSHLPDKDLFFRNVSKLLKKGGKLVVADWFKDVDLSKEQMEADIKPIEGETQTIFLMWLSTNPRSRWYVAATALHDRRLRENGTTGGVDCHGRTKGH